MKRLNFALAFILIAIFLTSCDPKQEHSCYPERVTITLKSGGGASSVIKDFKYEDKQLTRVIWSTFQTDDYLYDDEGTLIAISSDFQQLYEVHRKEFQYDKGLVARVNEYVISIDGFTGLGTDTILNAYSMYVYEGDMVAEEEIYLKDEDSGSIQLSEIISYDYDGSGNMLSFTRCNAGQTDTLEAYTFEYDMYRNPYYSVYPEFTRESYINNIITKTDMLNGSVYTYNMIPENSDFPDQINIMDGVYLSEVIRIDYACD